MLDEKMVGVKISMKRFKQFFKEELNLKQKDVVSSWLPKDDPLIRSKAAEELTGHVIPEGKHHTVMPAVAHVKNAVNAHLNSNGYQIHSYVDGTAIDRHGRINSIGKVLHKTGADEDLKNDFANDDKKAAEDLEKHDVIISRHPYHVAECSTGKKWSSCAGLTSTGKPTNVGQGAAAKKLKDEINAGTHVAYLSKRSKDDDNESRDGIQKRIDKASARVLLKPYESESGHKVLVPENKVYSKEKEGKNLGFLHTVRKFTEQHTPMKSGEIYTKNRNVYDDDASRDVPKFKPTDESINTILNSENQKAKTALRSRGNLSRQQLHRLIDHHNDPVWDKEAMHELAYNSNLKKDHIDKLLSRNDEGVNETLAFRHNLSDKQIGHLIDKEPTSTKLEALIDNKNKNQLSSDHIHKIISHFKKPNFVEYDDREGSSLGKTLGELPDHKNFNQSHVDALVKGFKNHQLDNTILEKMHKKHGKYDTLNPEQKSTVDEIENKWKKEDTSYLNPFRNPYLNAQKYKTTGKI